MRDDVTHSQASVTFERSLWFCATAARGRDRSDRMPSELEQVAKWTSSWMLAHSTKTRKINLTSREEIIIGETFCAKFFYSN